MTIIDEYNKTDYLESVSFIAGSNFELEFHLLASGDVTIGTDVPVYAGGAFLKWFLSPYGQPDICVLEKEVISSGNGVFSVVLDHNDTYNLGGTYIQQLEIKDISGKSFRPAQGIVVVREAIRSNRI